VVALYTRSSKPANTRLAYCLRDHLGSLMYLVSPAGVLLEEYAYDPWGRRRDPLTWKPLSGVAATARGFTGHEHIDLFDLVNMDGRVYDPRLGRFLSPDPYVQDPFNSQSYNRYAYCLNNPLSFTDPSGYSWFSRACSWVGKNWRPIVTTVVAVAVGVVVTVATAGIGSPVAIAMISGAAAGFAGGVTGTALNGGSFSQCLGAGIQGAVIGGFAGFAGGAAGVGAAWALNAATGISGGIIGGAVAGAAGGFAGGFVGSAMMGQSFNESLQMGLYGAIAGGVIGGIAGGYEAYKSEHARVADGNLDVMGNEMNDEQLISHAKSLGIEEGRNGLESLSTENTPRGYSYNKGSHLYVDGNGTSVYGVTQRSIWTGNCKMYISPYTTRNTMLLNATLIHENTHVLQYYTGVAKAWGYDKILMERNALVHELNYYNSLSRTNSQLWRHFRDNTLKHLLKLNY